MIQLDERVVHVIHSEKMKQGVHNYLNLLNLYQISTDVSNDMHFQTKYKGFYSMGRKSKDFYEMYFTYMQLLRNCDISHISFEEIFSYIKSKTNRNEASFSSKLMHTIDNHSPILDRYVLQNLELYRQYLSKNTDKIALFYQMKNIINGMLLNSNDVINKFDHVFPNEATQITKEKKLDFILWQMR